MDISLPGKWNDWTIKKLIGKGAYGSVYQAGRGQEVCAIKVIRVPEDDTAYEQLLREYMSPEALHAYFEALSRRLKKEISFMMALKDHPNIVQILDCEIEEQPDGYGFTIFLQMEYLTPLTKYLESHYLNEDQLITLGIDLCNALEMCHEKGLIHRDIKPDNIFIDRGGRAKLGDFGLATQLDINKKYMSVKGSIAYMAPEVFQGKTYDHRADEYSLALTLYKELNNGREPFLSPSKGIVSISEKEDALKLRIAGKNLLPPMNASSKLWRILKKALSFDPDKRYDSIRSMRMDLMKLQRGNFKHPRMNHRQQKRLLITAFLFMAVILAIFILFFLHQRHERMDLKEAATVQEYTTALDREIWSSFASDDYTLFCRYFDGYSEEDFETLRSDDYEEGMDETCYFELAEADGIYYCEELHYDIPAVYPDPESKVNIRRLTYTIRTADNGFYLASEDKTLTSLTLSMLPEAFQDARKAERNTADFPLAYHWQDDSLTFKGTVAFDIASAWQNADRSVELCAVILNGTGQTRIVNDMDYVMTDSRLGVIAEGKCTDEYSIPAGQNLSFNIKIPADQIKTGWNDWTKVSIDFSPNID